MLLEAGSWIVLCILDGADISYNLILKMMRQIYEKK